jgi:hemolysin activation/secretion protein
LFRQAICAAAILAALPCLGHAQAAPTLRGVLYLASAAALQPAGIKLTCLPKSHIAAPGLPFLETPGFAAEIAPLLGAPITLQNLAALQRDAQLSYISHGQPFVDVTLPPQNINSGIVQIIVTAYHVGAVTVTGNRWFAAPLIIRESGLAPGDILALRPLRDDLAFLNQNPFRTVSLLFAPGATTGATNVELHVTDRLPLRLYASFDNQGVENLGRDEWSTGFTWGNAFGQDQILSYQFTRTTLNRYTAHALNWTIPLPGDDKFLLFGADATERPQIGPFFNETGHSLQASLRNILTLPDAEPAPNIRLTADIQLGYDYKTANNNLAFGGVDVFASAAAIDQFPLISDISETDRFGQTQLSNMLVASPGGLTAGNNKSAFTLNEPGASPRYLYDNAALTRVTFLPAGFSLTSRLLAQAATTNLLYSEQLGLGGGAGLPGYVTDTALGSDGILLSQELRAPAFSLSHLLHMTLPDTEQLGAFWDSGHVSQVHPIYGAPGNADLASAGLDLHASLGRGTSLSFNIGWQLRPPPGTAKRSAFTDLSIVIGD